MRCQFCGFDDPEDFPFCSECGRPRAAAPPSDLGRPASPLNAPPVSGYSPPHSPPLPPPHAVGHPVAPAAPAVGGPTVASARLIGTEGPVEGQEYSVDKPEFTIGRRSDCDIVVSDLSVSRQHARIRQVAGGYLVEDGGSANGTWVNGVRVETTQSLVERDIIRIGKAAFTFHVPVPPGAARPGEMTMVSDLGPEPSVFGSGTEVMNVPPLEKPSQARAEIEETPGRPPYAAPVGGNGPPGQPQSAREAGAAKSSHVRAAITEIESLERDLGPLIERLRLLSESVGMLGDELKPGAGGRQGGLQAGSAPNERASEQLRKLAAELQVDGGSAIYADLEGVLEAVRQNPNDPQAQLRLSQRLPDLQDLLRRYSRALAVLREML